MARFGEILVELRQDKQLTQKDLADFLHVSKGTISNYEKGVHDPDIEKLLILAKYFDVTVDYLLGYAPYSVSTEILQKAVGNGLKMFDLVRIISQLPPKQQQSVSCIISGLEHNPSHEKNCNGEPES